MNEKETNMVLLRELHNNIWGILKHLMKFDTFVLILVVLFDLVMIPIAFGLRTTAGVEACFALVLVVGFAFSLLLLNNRRIQRQQVDALRAMYTDLGFDRYYSEKTTGLYSRRYDLFVFLILTSSVGTLLITYFWIIS
ncbi:MAG: hypothetical protein H7A21_13350 [Spirochaetales bacterium]|nr:hypothetical protein [Leptospiraceae bacterium]MCP5482415.1 hypothetical protein [Spirochaetales bacterium]MCP5485881.1 hypothetical protein [Spirochaetales bacterium]